MNLFTEALNLMKSAAIAGGGLLLIWGFVGLGTSLSEQNGAGIQTAAWKIVGGGVIILGGVLFAQISL